MRDLPLCVSHHCMSFDSTVIESGPSHPSKLTLFGTLGKPSQTRDHVQGRRARVRLHHSVMNGSDLLRRGAYSSQSRSGAGDDQNDAQKALYTTPSSKRFSSRVFRDQQQDDAEETVDGAGSIVSRPTARSISRPRRGVVTSESSSSSSGMLTKDVPSTPISRTNAARSTNTTAEASTTSSLSPMQSPTRPLVRRMLDSIDSLLPIPKAVRVSLRNYREGRRRLRASRRAGKPAMTDLRSYAHDLAEDQEYLNLLEEVYQGQHGYLLPVGLLLTTLAVGLFYWGVHLYLHNGQLFAVFAAANIGLLISRWAYLYWVSIRQINTAKLVLANTPIQSSSSTVALEYEPGMDPMSRIRRVMLRVQAQSRLMDKIEAEQTKLSTPKPADRTAAGLLRTPFADQIPFVDVTERFEAEREAERLADEKYGRLPGGHVYPSEMIIDPHGGPGPRDKDDTPPAFYTTPLRRRPISPHATPLSPRSAGKTVAAPGPMSAPREEPSQSAGTSPYLSWQPAWVTSFVYTVGPIALMTASPLLAFFLVLSVMDGKATLQYVFALMRQPNLFDRLMVYAFGNAFSWRFWSAFLLLQVILMVFLPGKLIHGITTKGRYTPVHRLNGLLSFAITLFITLIAVFGVSESNVLCRELSHLCLKLCTGRDCIETCKIGVKGFLSPLEFYENLPYVLGSGSVLVFGICVMLYLKALIAPTSMDNVFTSTSGSASGNIVFDFYSGGELYPTLAYPTLTYFKRKLASLYAKTLGRFKPIDLGSVDVNADECWFQFQLKTFIHSRIGMTLWGVLVVLLALASVQFQLQAKRLTCANFFEFLKIAGPAQTAVLLSALIQVIFVARHYYWEAGYLASTDIIHDHEGFYLVYGCAIFMPFTFTLPSLFLVRSANVIPLPPVYCQLGIFALAVLFLVLNYVADEQKLRARRNPHACKIWGKPANIITAGYFDSFGRFKQSYLLASGFWGVARHFHFTLDWAWVLLSVFISATPSFILLNPILLFYPAFLLAIFIDRALRDDLRCARKYGTAWSLYCEQVPYKMFPKVF